MKILFIPSDTYFTEKLDELTLTFTNKLGIDYTIFDRLKNLQPKEMHDIYITIMGSRCKIVDMGVVTKVIPSIRIWIKGFGLIAFFFYNINSAYKLIRGVSLFDGFKYNGGER